MGLRPNGQTVYQYRLSLNWNAKYLWKSGLKGMWATSLDFSDAYHHIPIRPDYHKYLAFQFKDKRYWYTVCPFGLSPIPQVFTAAMEPLKIHARTCLGIATYQYIDDWLLLVKNPTEAATKTIQFAHLCLSLGMLVNLDKSELAPSQHITHLGIEWNLQNRLGETSQETNTIHRNWRKPSM